jgi:hypothetical protein
LSNYKTATHANDPSGTLEAASLIELCSKSSDSAAERL